MHPDNHTLRRADRGLSEEDAIEIIRRSHGCTMATSNGNVPYIVPVSTVLFHGCIYFHCAKNAGRKEENLKANPQVALCFVGPAKLHPTEFSMLYESAIAEGTAELVTDPQEKFDAVMALCEHNAFVHGMENAKKHYGEEQAGADVWRIHLDKVSGKARRV